MTSDHQFTLLKQRRFLPFFLTQLAGAFNDNVFKNALIIMIVFQGSRYPELSVDTLVNICAGLFILPFLLFSATAGQVADRMDKATLIRWIKLGEVVIMTAAAVAFLTQSVMLLIFLLFLMGTQSAFFGPVKYSILPHHLSDRELVGGNGLVETGTFVAILTGTMVGGILVGVEQTGHYYVAAILVFIAIIGYTLSRYIPASSALDVNLKINWNPISEIWRTYKFTRRNRTVYLSILGVSWFWFFGATYLTQLPNFTKLSLGGNEQLVTLVLTLFSLGIGIGSLLCERLSGQKVEIGLVPFGAIGLTLFGVDLYFSVPGATDTALIGAAEFIRHWPNLRVIADILLLGIFGGFYIVPLYALIQQRSEASHRSRIIAGNNILNALFMVLSSLLAIVLLNAGLTISQLFLVVSLLNALVAIYIFSLVPEFLMRFLVWLLIHSIYRVKTSGLENIPDDKPVVLVCNHVSYVDAMVIAACVRRPVRFVMYYRIYRLPVLNFVFRTAKTIPIAGLRENREMLEQAYRKISAELQDDQIVCIFPEGKLTADGNINTFRPGIDIILKRDPVPVVPMALTGLWDSPFSRKNSFTRNLISWRLLRKIALRVGPALPPDQVSAAILEETVKSLFNDATAPALRAQSTGSTEK